MPVLLVVLLKVSLPRGVAGDYLSAHGLCAFIEVAAATYAFHKIFGGLGIAINRSIILKSRMVYQAIFGPSLPRE